MTVPAHVRLLSLGLILLPPWMVYLIALLGWGQGWLNEKWLEMGLLLEIVALHAFPFLGMAVLVRPQRFTLKVVRWAAIIFFIYFYTELVRISPYGMAGVALFWLGAGLTYLGWIWVPKVTEDRFVELWRRWFLCGVAGWGLFIGFSLMKELNWMEERTVMLMTGFCYFLALHIAEVTGFFRRPLLPWNRIKSEADLPAKMGSMRLRKGR